MTRDTNTEVFEAARPQLTGLAYRLLGSISDAQDAVQDTYLKWLTHSGTEIENPPAWLTRVCTNCCLDRLKSAHVKRVDYVGQWIPEQLQTEFEGNAEESLELNSSLTTAFLLLLERLTPKERAAYLLHDIFGQSFDEIAEALEMQPANCRKLAARARGFVTQNKVRFIPDETRQSQLVAAFQMAIESGDTHTLGRMLRSDSDLRADSGGRVVAVADILEGAAQICDFVSNVLSRAWAPLRITQETINGLSGLVIRNGDAIHATISFAYDQEGLVSNIYIMRNPKKLALTAATKGVVARSGALRLH